MLAMFGGREVRPVEVSGSGERFRVRGTGRYAGGSEISITVPRFPI